MNILLTGSTGFVGQRILERLLHHTDAVMTLPVRNAAPPHDTNRAHYVSIDGISDKNDWDAMLHDCDIVIHAAARVHIQGEQNKNPLEAYRQVNTYGTLNLARQAAQAGVKRFIFISTVKVHGEKSPKDTALHANSPLQPTCEYGLSKAEAEKALQLLAKETGIEVVIIRPVLVYGAGVKGNFLSLLSVLREDSVLPLGFIRNKRSFVSVNNLADFIVTCTMHPNAANEAFLVSDREDLSTTALLKKCRALMGGSSRLLPLPELLVRGMAACVGKQVEADRLCDSLVVDIQKNTELLNWSPTESMDEALRSTVEAFLE